jgi:hypothetical protein
MESHDIDLFHNEDLASNDPTSLMALLFWYVIVEAKPSHQPWNWVILFDVHQHYPCMAFMFLQG